MFLRVCSRRAFSPTSCSLRTWPCTAMPLRAKITRPFSTMGQSDDPLLQPQPEDDPDDVLFDKNYGVRTIELNRPKKLNSLNSSMARKIIPRLQEWSKSQMANVVIVKGKGRALCAGGDVAELAQQNSEGPEGQQKSKDYFALEYKLDHLIATYSKPYMSFMDGITMGGGVGLSIHAPFRIATENTVFAMPETTIGFFPDVGASFFLPKMDGGMGMYLALTSQTLNGWDCLSHGVATHYINSAQLPDLESRLGELIFKDYASNDERYRIINNTVEEYVTESELPKPKHSGYIRFAIDTYFGPKMGSVAEITDALRRVVDPSSKFHPDIVKWAKRTLYTLGERSPTSLAVTFAQLRFSQRWSIAETFEREHFIASRFMEHHDFVEGVTARLVRKTKERPLWQPSKISDLAEQDIAAFFKFPQQPELKLLNTAGQDYSEYPHAWLGLPSEKTIIEERKKHDSDKQCLRAMLASTNYKFGVKEKVLDVLERRNLLPEDER
ncbi:3-hydroxyisobutyryl-CoA hydrolase mitochondrial precursor [Phyllosticta citrichinensis]|uniref:3-hydroxyisobutyryl-CoA hydrolase n=1 Tax=Phyllosticta citrichinensis TaxID=1130410 RepID=A0ABR1XK21_9PEZI